jgi:hypothetical protein
VHEYYNTLILSAPINMEYKGRWVYSTDYNLLSTQLSVTKCLLSVVYPGFFFFLGGGVQQIQLRSEDRENGDLGAVATWSGVLEAAVFWYKKFHSI